MYFVIASLKIFKVVSTASEYFRAISCGFQHLITVPAAATSDARSQQLEPHSGNCVGPFRGLGSEEVSSPLSRSFPGIAKVGRFHLALGMRMIVLYV
jgi:hypothetical protein